MTVSQHAHPLARRVLVPKPFAEACATHLARFDGLNGMVKGVIQRIATEVMADVANTVPHLHVPCTANSEVGKLILASLIMAKKPDFKVFFFHDLPGETDADGVEIDPAKPLEGDPLAAAWEKSNMPWVERWIVLSAAEAAEYDARQAEWNATKGKQAAA
ncbi:MAG: hypothetical protein ACK5YK_01925 [Pseudomonadota bacterium]|jgi:hypothetical protein